MCVLLVVPGMRKRTSVLRRDFQDPDTYLMQPISRVIKSLVYFTTMDFDFHSCSLRDDKFVSDLCPSGMEPIDVPLEENGERTQICQSKVCADRVNTYDCGEKISSWLSKFLGRPCHLIKQSSSFQRNAKKKQHQGPSAGATATLSLVNEAQYLLVNRPSVLELQQQLTASDENGREKLFLMKDLISRFRANIITNGTRAFEEEKWDEILIGSLHFQVLGPCHRCQMICIDQQTGQRNQDVFQKLSEYRERKVNFGVYLMHMALDLSSPRFLSVGSQVFPVLKENIECPNLPASKKHPNIIS